MKLTQGSRIDMNLDDAIIEIYKQTSRSTPSSIWKNIFNALKNFIFFDSAIVTHLLIDGSKDTEVVYAYLYNFPKISQKEYSEICKWDFLNIQSMARDSQPNAVSALRLSEYISDFEMRKLEFTPINWVNKYDVLDILTCFNPRHDIKTPYGISLTRKCSGTDFNSTDASIFSQLIPHLWNAVEINLEVYLSKEYLSNSSGQLVVDKAGQVFYENISLLKSNEKIIEKNIINAELLKAGKNNSDWGGYKVVSEYVDFTDLLFINLIKQDQFSLTPAESRVLHILSQGFSLKQTGLRLSISEHTVANHARRIYSKLGVSGKHELIGLEKVVVELP